MSAINFPDPSQSPWTNSSTGITYTYSNGVWKALSSEETFLKQTDAESTYLKQVDANFVSLSDGGTQQVISGGGGLNVDGDVQKKGNTVPSAVMGASAPSNPGICDFWTDTSGDDPVLKSWNGTEWVEVGSSGVVTSELPELPSTLESTDLLVIERSGVQYRIPSEDLVPVTGAIHTPVEVLTPFDGAGVGGDRSYSPMTNTISAISLTERSSRRTYGSYSSEMQFRDLAWVNNSFFLAGNATSYSDRYYQGLKMDPLSGIDYVQSFMMENGSNAMEDRYGFAYGLGIYVSVGHANQNNYDSLILVTNDPTGTWIGRNESQNFGELKITHWYGNNYGARYIDFNDVHFANNMFVAVAQTDSWTSRASNHNNAYYDELTIYTSSDGLNWTYRYGPRGQWGAVTYGNGRWIVVGKSDHAVTSSTRMATSTDGVSWSSVSGAPGWTGFGDIVYGNGMFVTVAHYSGSENNNSPIAYSTDGLNWSTANATPGRYTHITYGDGKFVAYNGSYGSYRGKIVVSEDGINWTTHAGPKDDDGSELYVRGLAYGGGWFYAGGEGYVFRSADGRNWDQEKASITLLNDDVLDSSDSSVVNGASLSTVIPQYSTVQSDSNAGVTGEIYEITSPTTMTLYNVVGSWTTGMKMVSQTPVTSYAPSPADITFTSENADTTAVSATGTTLLSRTWTLETRASDSDPWTVQVEYEDFSIASSQDGATPWTTNKPTLLPNTQYRVKVAYNALGARTQESPYHTFTTGDF